jgi:DNA-binding MarR family transcriptional regulator
MVSSRVKMPASLLNSEAFMIGRLRGRLVKKLMEEHSKLGLRFGSGTILICIEDIGPLSQRDLCELLEVDPSELVRHIDLL